MADVTNSQTSSEAVTTVVELACQSLTKVQKTLSEEAKQHIKSMTVKYSYTGDPRIFSGGGVPGCKNGIITLNLLFAVIKGVNKMQIYRLRLCNSESKIKKSKTNPLCATNTG